MATDFGGAAASGLLAALALAERFESRVTLAHVFELPNAPFVYERRDPDEPYVHAAERILEEAVSDARRCYKNVESLLMAGVPSERLIETIEHRAFDLVVMGTHGRKGLDRILLGSVASKVLRSSPVPVMIVPDERGPKGAAPDAGRS